MIKTVGLVSLSRGTIGEDFVKHELDLGVRRLKEYGLTVKFMDNALKGIDYLKEHPDKRAEDFLQAFSDPEIDMILCAVGGDDTYRLLPYLFENEELQKAVKKKIFLGFSDSTMNHFMLYKTGLNTFYGQSFLSDICELGKEMLPYTRKYFEELIMTGMIKEITPSDVWYEGRTNYDKEQVGVELTAKPNRGYELLQGTPVFHGEILGGCADTIFDIFDGERYGNSPELCSKYELFPSKKDWEGKILLLETSEEKMSPDKLKKVLLKLKETGIFEVVHGVLVGKPMDEAYYEEYKEILIEAIDNPTLPIVYNVNIGHALPRCIIPFGVEATVDVEKQKICFYAE